MNMTKGKGFLWLMVFISMMILIVSCAGGGGRPPGDDPLAPPEYFEAQQGFFTSGILVHSQEEILNQLYPTKRIYIRTTGGNSGFLVVSAIGTELELDLLLYNEQGAVSIQKTIQLQSGQSYDLDEDGFEDITWNATALPVMARGQRNVDGTLEFLYHFEEGIACQYNAFDESLDNGILRWFFPEDSDNGDRQASPNKLIDLSVFEILDHDPDQWSILIADHPHLLVDPGDVILVNQQNIFNHVERIEPGGNGVKIFYEEERPDPGVIFDTIHFSFDSKYVGSSDSSSAHSRETTQIVYAEDWPVYEGDLVKLTILPWFELDARFFFDFSWNKGYLPLIGEYRKWGSVDHMSFGLDGKLVAELVARLEIEKEWEANPSISATMYVLHPLANIFTIGVTIELGVDLSAKAKATAEIGVRALCERLRWKAEARTTLGIVHGFDVYDYQDSNSFTFERIGPTMKLEGELGIQPYISVTPVFTLLSGAAESGIGLKSLIDISGEGSWATNEEISFEAGVESGLDWEASVDLLWGLSDWTKWEWDGVLINIQVMEFSMGFPWAPYNLRSEDLEMAMRDSEGVHLLWDSDSEVTDGYEVFRLDQQDKLGITDEESFLDTNVQAGQEYAYRTRAFSYINLEYLGRTISEETKDWRIYSYFSNTVKGTFGEEEEEEPDTFLLTLLRNPAAGGSVEGAGEYEEGEAVAISATAHGGYQFINWTEEGDEISDEPEHTYIMPAKAVTLVAHFEKEEEPEPDGPFHNTTQNTWHETFADAESQAEVGDEILVYPGTYTEAFRISKSLTVRSVSGPGDTIFETIWTQNAPYGIRIEPFHWSTEDMIDHVTLSGFTIRPSNSETRRGRGIFIQSTHSARIENNIISSYDRGIAPAWNYGPGWPFLDTLEIIDNRIFDCSGSAIDYWERGRENPEFNIIISGNTLSDNEKNGIVIQILPPEGTIPTEHPYPVSSHTLEIRENQILSNQEEGLYFKGWADPIIENNRISNNGQHGILIDSAIIDNIITVHNNMITGNMSSGIWGGQYIGNLIITQNTISENQNSGIHFPTQYSYGTSMISNNTISSNRSANVGGQDPGNGGGVNIRSEHQVHALSNNIIENNIAVGRGGGVFIAQNNFEVTMVGNTIRQNHSGLGGGGVHGCASNWERVAEVIVDGQTKTVFRHSPPFDEPTNTYSGNTHDVSIGAWGPGEDNWLDDAAYNVKIRWGEPWVGVVSKELDSKLQSTR